MTGQIQTLFLYKTRSYDYDYDCDYDYSRLASTLSMLVFFVLDALRSVPFAKFTSNASYLGLHVFGTGD